MHLGYLAPLVVPKATVERPDIHVLLFNGLVDAFLVLSLRGVFICEVTLEHVL